MSMVGRVFGDHLEHQCALGDEPVGVRGLGQPVEEAFHSEVLQQLVERSPAVSGPVEEALPDGRGYVASGRYRVASR